MPEGSRKAAKGNRGTILQNWQKLSFTLRHRIRCSIPKFSHLKPSQSCWVSISIARVASLSRTGAGGRNIPSNSKKAYQSFEAQDWQDLLHSHLFRWSFCWSYTAESDFKSQFFSYLQAKDGYSRRQERESGRVEAFWSMALNDVFGFVASISFSSRRRLSLGNREPMSPSCSSGLEHAYWKNCMCWM